MPLQPAPPAQPPRFQDLHRGDRAAFTVRLTQELAEEFARFIADPVPGASAEPRLPMGADPLLRGIWVSAFLSRLVGMYLPGHGALYLSQDLQFRRPAQIGDELEVSGEVIHKSEAAQVLTLHTRIARLTGEVLAEGEARVMMMETSTPQVQDLQFAGLQLAGRVALVTGGSRGIGAAIARLLARHGAQVAVSYRTSRAEAENLVAQITAAGQTARAFKAEAGAPDQVGAMFAQITAEWGPVTILVNNASASAKPKAFAETTWEDYQASLTTTVGGAYHAIQCALPGMLRQKSGRIINVGTSAILGAPPDKLSSYIIAKQALAGLTKSLAVELGPLGITVNMVAPGLTETAFTAHLPRRLKDLAAIQTPLRRNASLEDTAQAVAFLASDMAGFVNGIILPVAGGSVMA